MHKLDLKFKIDCWIYRIRYWWGVWHIREGYHNIKNFFFPQQAWLVKGMYHDWCDKPELIKETLYRCIINYVEEEKCFEYIDWDHTHIHKECSAFITDCYDWIKVRRPKLHQQIEQIIYDGYDSSWLSEGEARTENKKTYEEMYPNLVTLEKELAKEDDKYLTGIVKWRDYLWV